MIRKIGDWARGLTQEQRNAFYKVAAAIGAACVAMGFITAEEVDHIFTVAGSVITLVSTLLAIPNSGSKVKVKAKEPTETGFIGDDYRIY